MSEEMSRRSVILVAAVLLAYFAFTSGAVYELTGSEDTNRLVTPYSIALSGERTGLAGIFSKDDLDGAEWLQDGQGTALTVVCDGNIGLLLRGYQMANTAQMVYFAGAFSAQPHYLFLSTWNVESGKIISGAWTAGLREVSRIPDIDLGLYDEVFRSGKTVILQRKIADLGTGVGYPKISPTAAQRHEKAEEVSKDGGDGLMPLKISVVIPNLNSGKWLGKSLDSIFHQDYKDFEVIVADGGSTDGSFDILYWYQEDHPNLHVYPVTTEGEAAHVNDGMELAQGDVVAWLCADDTYAPGCFREVAEAFQNPEVEWVYGRSRIIDEEGRETRAIVTKLKELFQPRYSYLALQCASFIAEPTVFMRSEFQRKVGRYDEALPLVADYDYWLRAGKLSSPVFIDRHLANWRAREGSVSLTNYQAQMLGMYELQRKYSPAWLRPAQWTTLQLIQAMYRRMNGRKR